MARKRSDTPARVVKQEISSSQTQKNAFECPAEVAAVLIEIGQVERFEGGTILFEKGEGPKGIYLLLEGRVALSSGEDPTRITRVADKNSLLGLPATVRNRPYSLTAEAVTDISVCHVGLDRFRETLKNNSVLGLSVINMLAEEISVLRNLAVYKVKK